MKKLKEIKQMIDSAQERWIEIRNDEKFLPLCNASVVEKMENLKNLLENIREGIESLLSYSHSALLVKVCKLFLEQTLLVSEKLRLTYAFAGYNESYYIFDTLVTVEKLAKN